MSKEVPSNPAAGASEAARSSASGESSGTPKAHVVARLYGEPLTDIPPGLYIPPDALEVVLERFEGPLDLLLWLIRSQKFDVMDIPMAVLTEQYMAYVELIRRTNLELASAYLVMAATLMSIKSRMLLPKRPDALTGEEVEDPRAELMRRLQEYERMRAAAKTLDALPRLGRDFLTARPVPEDGEGERLLPMITASELALAWEAVEALLAFSAHHRVSREELSVREHMTEVLRALQGKDFIRLTDLYEPGADRQQIAVWLLAVLELGKHFLVNLTQAEPYGAVYIRPEHSALFADAGAGGQVRERTVEEIDAEWREFFEGRAVPGSQGELF
ncbi:segregation and condensation protein A [Sutterella sp.]|uniref:segregation and condensation protein A n=1 Tax=Sutterella sp. TaxID=1981025 RepID=UPI003FD72AF0